MTQEKQLGLTKQSLMTQGKSEVNVSKDPQVLAIEEVSSFGILFFSFGIRKVSDVLCGL